MVGTHLRGVPYLVFIWDASRAIPTKDGGPYAIYFASTAWAAARRAIGTRNGLQLT